VLHIDFDGFIDVSTWVSRKSHMYTHRALNTVMVSIRINFSPLTHAFFSPCACVCACVCLMGEGKEGWLSSNQSAYAHAYMRIDHHIKPSSLLAPVSPASSSSSKKRKKEALLVSFLFFSHNFPTFSYPFFTCKKKASNPFVCFYFYLLTMS
jgi:hypothetical protein